MSLLSVKNLTVGYGAHIIIENQTVAFERPEIVSVIGPNGSGKSTFLKALIRLIKAKSGAVELNGKNIQRWSTKAIARHMSLLPQITSAPEGMLVKQLVRSGRYPYVPMFREPGIHDENVVESAMRATDVWKYRYTTVGHLSGGERQRVWLALSLAQEPEILLLDEPTTYLDSRHQIELMDLVKRTQRERNITVIMVLHDLNLALRYSDRIVVIKDGMIAGDGAPGNMMTEENLAAWFGIKADILYSPRVGDDAPICVPYGIV